MTASATPSLLPRSGEDVSDIRGRSRDDLAAASAERETAGEPRRLLAPDWLAAIASLVLAALTIGRGYETIILVATVAMAPLVAWIVVQDLRSFTIPDGVVVALATLAIAVRIAARDPALAIALDLLLTGGVLLAFREVYFRRRGFDGLGLGDVKLAAAGGLLVGAQAFAAALLGASLLALAGVVAVHLASRDRTALAGRKLAFGALLAPAIYLAWLVQALPFLQGS